MMRLLHIGITSDSEKRADDFFRDLLGMEKTEPKTVAASLAKPIFGVDADVRVINYTGSGLQFEVFIGAPRTRGADPFPHVCLAVKDLTAFLKKSRDLGIETFQVPRGDNLLTFARDGAGNLFEIKERKIE
jgi:catechol 2,3-dioxygenase-like lactoylglutathione lyase family enzyme